MPVCDMPDCDMDEMIAASASEVLETMFFSTVLGSGSAEQPDAAALCTRLAFHGDPSGSFGLSLPHDCARAMAADFLGEELEDLEEARVEEVICELTNMICGSFLSRFESTGTFELRHPVLAPYPDSSTVSRSFELDAGHLTVWLTLSPNQ